MKLAFVVNDVQTELATYTTTRLAMAATNMGHKTFTFGVGDFICAPDGSIHAVARRARGKSYKSLDKFLADLQLSDQPPESINLDEFDVVMLRNDPSSDAIDARGLSRRAFFSGSLSPIAALSCSTIRMPSPGR